MMKSNKRKNSDGRGGTKIALVYPPHADVGIFRRAQGVFPPQGLLFIASTLEKAGHEVDIIDMEHRGMRQDEIGRIFDNGLYDLVGITAFTATLKTASRISAMAKETGATTVIGGPCASSSPAATANHCDHAIVGEGEYAMVELADRVAQGRPVKEVAGVYTRGAKDFRRRPPIPNIDELPIPAYHKLKGFPKGYRPYAYINLGKKFSTMYTSRGCPFRCIFCDAYHVMGRRYRGESPERVMREIRLLYENYGVRHITFFDDEFTVLKRRVVGICDELTSSEIDLLWGCLARCDSLSMDLAERMAKAGCFEVGLGCESGSNEVLKTLNKGITVEDIRRAIDACKKAEILTRTFWIIGCPGETYDEAMKTLKLILETDPDYAHIHICTPFPNTKLWEMYLDRVGKTAVDYEGLIVTDVSNTSGSFELSQHELRELLRTFNRRFYLRPKYIAKRLFKTRNLHQLYASINGSLGIMRILLEK